MQNIRAFITKATSITTYSIALVIVGIAFIALRGTALDVSLIVVGAAFALVGMSGIILTLLAPDHAPISSLFGYGAILRSSVALLFGILLITVRSAIPSVVCNALGAALIFYSLFRIARPLHRLAPRTREWYIESIIYSVLAVYGLFMVLFPLWPNVIGGIAMVLVGAKWIYDDLRKHKSGNKSGKNSTRVSPSRRPSKKNGSDIYSNDFIDKSN